MQYKVSVIIPIYNVEGYLKECLNSLVLQTLREIQVILVDDGSTDSSGLIADGYADEYENFEVYHIKNSGPAAARNYGVKKAKGEYLGFVDSDDWIEPSMYEMMYNTAKQNYDCDIVLTRVVSGESNRDDAFIKLRGGYYTKLQITEEILPYLLPRITPKGNFRSLRWSTCLRIFKRSIVVDNHIQYFEKSSRAEDLVFTFLCTVYSESYYYLDSCQMYHNRPREVSTSTGYMNNMWPAMRAVSEFFIAFSHDFSDYDFSQAAEETAFYFSVTSMLNESLLHNKTDSVHKVLSVMEDKVCRDSLNYIDTSLLNEKYTHYYNYTCERDAIGFLKYINKRKIKSKIISRISQIQGLSQLFKSIGGKL